MQLNSRLDQLLKAQEKVAHQAGVNSVLADGIAKELLSTAEIKATQLRQLAAGKAEDVVQVASDAALGVVDTASEVAKNL